MAFVLYVRVFNRRQELVAREWTVGAAHQDQQQVELYGRQVYAVAVQRHAAIAWVDAQAAHRYDLCGHGGGQPLQPALCRLHARHQLARAKRLNHVVVRAQLQALNSVRFLHARRQHQDVHIGNGRIRIMAQAAGDLPAVNARQHEVKHD